MSIDLPSQKKPTANPLYSADILNVGSRVKCDMGILFKMNSRLVGTLSGERVSTSTETHPNEILPEENTLHVTVTLMLYELWMYLSLNQSTGILNFGDTGVPALLLQAGCFHLPACCLMSSNCWSSAFLFILYISLCFAEDSLSWLCVWYQFTWHGAPSQYSHNFNPKSAVFWFIRYSCQCFQLAAVWRTEFLLVSIKYHPKP